VACGRGVLARGEGLWHFIGEALRLGARRDRGGGNRRQQHVRRRVSAGKARRARVSGRGAWQCEFPRRFGARARLGRPAA
jgi:hypothetical protein